MPEYAKQTPAQWADEFNHPTLSGLLDGLEPEERAAFKAALESFRARTGCRDRIEWHGLPWRWALSITQPGLNHPALAYLVPRPEVASVCIPVPIGSGDLKLDELTKPVRIRLDRAPIVAGFLWPEWPIADLDPVAIRPLLEAREQAGS